MENQECRPAGAGVAEASRQPSRIQSDLRTCTNLRYPGAFELMPGLFQHRER